MNRNIKKAVILGSGIMGSRIACHFAGVGIKVLLLDIPPKELNESEKKKRLKPDNPKVRNRIVNDALATCLKSNPSPIYKASFASRITTGNFEDNIIDIHDADWIIEAVIEDLKIKHDIFEKVDQYRKKNSLVSTNTSGIPIDLMLKDRSEDFQKNFCGTHFFNPPRYLQLLEIIPSKKTTSETLEFISHFGDRYLGKTPVVCKSTPAFIANRIGMFSIMLTLKIMQDLKLSVQEIDLLTGPVSGKPKSATFRTSDLVGLDTLVKVANDLYDNCPDDEQRDIFTPPDFINKMIEKKWMGDKTGQGYYKKIKEDGKSIIQVLNLEKFNYEEKQKVGFASITAAKAVEDLNKRFKQLIKGKDKAGDFYRTFQGNLFSYVSNRIPEITDELYKIDDAMKAGFGWELGPFEQWDLLGVEKSLELIKKIGRKPASWVIEMIKHSADSFYKIDKEKQYYYDIQSKTYREIPGKEDFILLSNLKTDNIVWQNTGTTIYDIGDDVLNLEFHTKMNSIGGEVLEGLNKAIDLAEENYKGIVIGNEGANFSAGANIGMIFMLAVDQEYDEINLAIQMFQNTTMRIRYSSIPVVIAPHGLTLGGGCELCLHADQIQAAAETYIGLVEVGVGLIPAGGGTKELVLRASDNFYQGDTEIPNLQNYLLNIATAKVATSAYEAFDMDVFIEGRDHVTINKNRLIADAKQKVIALADDGYVQPIQRNDVKVLGQGGLGAFLTGVNGFFMANYMSEHDKKITEKLAYVMCGGDLSAPTKVSEQYLLDLEREAFLSLTGEKKTLERIQSILTTGKPLRN